VSDRPDIARFEPRVTADTSPEPLVWAVGERLLHNYLLPRDCPRVTFYAGPYANPADVTRLMAGTTARHVVAIEARWLDRVRAQTLYLYEMPTATFTATDPSAGYYVSRAGVTPIGVTVVDDVLAALLGRDVELRVVPSLHALRDLVVASTMQFSIIRWRNAAPEEL